MRHLVLLLIAVALLVGCTRRSASSGDPVADILHRGRLAPLPAKASAKQAEGWSGVFTGQDYLSFKLPAKARKAWLAASPALEGVEPERFQAEQALAAPGACQGRFRHAGGDKRPAWYGACDKPFAGARYDIPADAQGHNRGEVVVDSAAGRVWVSVVFD